MSELARALDDFDQWPDPDSTEPWELVMCAARRQVLLEPDTDGNYNPKTVEAVAAALVVLEQPGLVGVKDLAIAILDALRDFTEIAPDQVGEPG